MNQVTPEIDFNIDEDSFFIHLTTGVSLPRNLKEYTVEDPNPVEALGEELIKILEVKQ